MHSWGKVDYRICIHVYIYIYVHIIYIYIYMYIYIYIYVVFLYEQHACSNHNCAYHALKSGTDPRLVDCRQCWALYDTWDIICTVIDLSMTAQRHWLNHHMLWYMVSLGVSKNKIDRRPYNPDTPTKNSNLIGKMMMSRMGSIMNISCTLCASWDLLAFHETIIALTTQGKEKTGETIMAGIRSGGRVIHHHKGFHTS